MSSGHTRVNLADVVDAARSNGFEDRWEARVARADLGARVAPDVARAFEAGPAGLEFIAFGPHREADGEPVEDGWVA
jgi:hypothetical protein